MATFACPLTHSAHQQFAEYEFLGARSQRYDYNRSEQEAPGGCRIWVHGSDAQGTDSKDKNELLFSTFGINYNNIPPMFRKGSTLIRQDPNAALRLVETEVAGVHINGGTPESAQRRQKKIKAYEGMTGEVVVLHEDIIGDAFWSQRPWLLA